MARDIHANTLTELSGKVIRPILLLKLLFDTADGGDVKYWNGIGDFIYDGDTYTGAGGMARITSIKEDSALRASGTKFELDGIPSANIAVAFNVDYQERKAKLWLALVDSTLTIVGDAVLIFSGRMDQMDIEENGETSSIAVSVENRLIDLERPKIRYYVDEDQKREYPSDKGLNQVAPLNSGVELLWGGGS